MNRHLADLTLISSLVSVVALTVAFFSAAPLLGAAVTRAESEAAALAWMGELHGTREGLSIRETIEISGQTSPLIAIYNLNPTGWVIVAQEDSVHPILAYSEAGAFPTQIDSPGVVWWLGARKQQISSLRLQGRYSFPEAPEWIRIREARASTTVPAERAAALTPVTNLLKTTWAQSPFYNELCPIDTPTGVKTPTGCVATAMGQIMYYWAAPATGHGSHTDLTRYGSLTAQFGVTTYDWASMPEYLWISSNEAISTLLYHCGIAVDMQYGPVSADGSGGSGAWTYKVPSALREFFGYSSAARYQERLSASDSTAWDDLLRAELTAGRPVLYAGCDPSTTPEACHAFILSGFDDTGKYYVNWGWASSCVPIFGCTTANGYYALDSLHPNRFVSDTFTAHQNAVLHIKPSYQMPAPTLLPPTVPSSIMLGESIRLTVAARNAGLVDGTDGKISVSFPALNAVGDSLSLTVNSMAPGAAFNASEAGASGIDINGYRTTLEYLVGEMTTGPWNGEKALDISVRPKAAGPFQINVRATMGEQGAWVSDPDSAQYSLGGYAFTDQEGWVVRSYTVNVVNAVPTCTGWVLSPVSVNATAASGSEQVAVAGSPAGCQGGTWLASGNGSWLTVSPTSGSGSGTVTVSWSANPLTTTRSGTATIAGNSFGVSQAGTTAVAPPPPYLLLPGSSVFPGSTWASLSPPFSWVAVTGADFYQLELSDTSVVVTTQTVAAPQVSVVLGSGLTDNHAYKWRMRSHGTAGWGAFGGYYYFSTYTGLATGDFGLGATPSAGAVGPGGSAAFVINTWTAQGSVQTLTFSVGSLPAGVTASFSSGSVQSGGQSTLTLNVGSGTTPGGYSVTATATSNVGVAHSIAIGLTVNPPPASGQPAVCLTPASLGFSDEQIGTTSPAQTVMLQNCGNGSLHITGLSATADFTIPPGGIQPPIDLIAGGSTSFQVAFAPFNIGPRTGAARVASNAAGSPHSIALSGTATPAPVTTGIVNVQATINGEPYTGYVPFNVTGPSGTMFYQAVPFSLSSAVAGSYTVALAGGAPGGWTFTGIVPSGPQSLPAGGSVLFTFNFSGTNTFSLTDYDPPLVIPVGGSASTSISAWIHGGNQTFTLVASGLPSNATITFNPQPLVVLASQVGASTTATVSTTASTPVGIYNVTFSATNQEGTTHSISRPLAIVIPGTTELISTAFGGGSANGASDTLSISADGRYVAFASAASNLVSGDTNGANDIFVRDRLTASTSRVSVASDGSQADDWSGLPSISADGRYVAFQSAAGNLAPCAVRNFYQVFVRDRQLGRTSCVGVASDGIVANAYTGFASVSGDGRLITFTSAATNLAPGATSGLTQTYIRDVASGTTSLVSVGNDGAPANSAAEYPVISGDGRFVAFFSAASNLVPGVSGTQVYVRDRQNNATEVVSLASDGSPANGFIYDYSGGHLAISPDGRFVGFISNAPNFGVAYGVMNVVVRDRKLAKTTLASVANDGTTIGGQDLALSADGRFVAFSGPFVSSSSGQTGLRDLVLGQTRVVTLSPDAKLATGWSGAPVLSGDGRTVGFASDATNLVAGDTNGARDIFAVNLTSISGVVLQSLTASPTPAVGGSVVQGTLTLSGPAPTGGATVQLSSSSPEVQPPAVVTIPQGVTATTFSIPTSSVPSDRTIAIIASYGGSSPWVLLTLKASVPARIDILQGDQQIATAGSTFSVALGVRVVDSVNNPTAGVTVRFDAPLSGASGSFPGGVSYALVATNSQGIALAPALTANSAGGQFAVIATAAGVTLPAVFSVAIQGLSFYTVTPCRVVDTRAGSGFPSGYGPPSMAGGGAQRSFAIAGQCGIPAGAKAVSLNAAVWGPVTRGDYRIFPAGGVTPNASTMNWEANILALANAAFVPFGEGGAITVRVDGAGTVDIFIDVNGYFQ